MAGKETPLMQQHKAIKQKYPDAILLFRVGDFYETFGKDAIDASKVLGITLTKRNNGTDSSELAGFPYHALDNYLHKLVKAGFRVAICDQLEDPKHAKGIVKRGVTELVTPGVAIHDKMLDQNVNNFLAALHFDEDSCGIAFMDLSTGEFFTAEGNKEFIDKLIQSFQPAEIIYNRKQQKSFIENWGSKQFTFTLEDWVFQLNYCTELLTKHFETINLKGFGIDGLNKATIACGVILQYLKDTEHPNLNHLTRIQRLNASENLWMDQFTIRNLELLHPNPEHPTLLKILDNTNSPMGSRLLRRWILMPLKDINEINLRLDAVEYLQNNSEALEFLLKSLRVCGDLERLIAKVPTKKIGPREMLQLARGLQQVGAIKDFFTNNKSTELFKKLLTQLEAFNEIAAEINLVISQESPAIAAKGNIINKGVNAELDEWRELSGGGKAYLLKIQNIEQEKTGIPSLKIGFNNVFGYFLEVTNTHKDKVPVDWIRKQTLTNAERYITAELKEYEEKILHAEEKISLLEQSIYEDLVNKLDKYILQIQVNCQILATIDCLCSFAQVSIKQNYVKPKIHEGYHLNLTNSRHPVIEQNLPLGEKFIGNDLSIDNEGLQIMILTGPNMSGKSALLRQTALITLMSHLGCFVPADFAEIPITDKIFTRVGASDNLGAGESTFMVEMNETASIINNITSRSLILLDEIGRGTSTYDGIAIAWSIAEYLHNSNEKPKTLFATHYHELNELEEKLSRCKNYHISYKEIDNKIIFLRKLKPGGSTHSFGIHVAKMAGMPPDLISRANDIMHLLEDQRTDSNKNNINNSLKKITETKMQLSIFDTHTEIFEEIRNKLNIIDINRLTPVEALLKLQEIKNLLG